MLMTGLFSLLFYIVIMSHVNRVVRSSVVSGMLARYARSHGFESRSVICFFLPFDISGSVGPSSGCEQQRDVSSVPGTNLIQQGKTVTGRPCSSVAQ